MRGTEGDVVVYVRADSKLEYGSVMQLLGEVGQAGFARVSLLSTRLQGGPAPAGGAPPSP